MDFIDKINQLSKRIKSTKDQVQTEEATKHSLVMPFIQALGYDIFNPNEIVPEYTADVGIKKGEKVDYAIIQNEQPIILIECKTNGDTLDKHDSQLYRYFSVTKARFAILTDGAKYKFFTDLDDSNKMDTKPFLEIDFLDLKENLVPELKKFCKESFDVDEIMSSAGELKYTRAIKNLIAEEYKNPSKDFVKLFAKQVHPGMLTQNVIEKYTEIVQKAFNDFLKDKINERFESAIVKDTIENKPEEVKAIEEENNSKEIITTEEELEGYAVVKAVLRDSIDINRVGYKDTLTYFGINIDNSTRKTFCRLFFNTKNKAIMINEKDNNGVRQQIDSINDLYNYKDSLLAALNSFISE